MRPIGHVWCLHFCFWGIGIWRESLSNFLPTRVLESFAPRAESRCSPEHLYESAWICRAGQGALQASDHCLRSTSSASGWIGLASLYGHMSYILISPSEQDPELCAVSLVGLLWRVTLKEVLQWAVKMLLMSALLWGRTGLVVQLYWLRQAAVFLSQPGCFSFSDREFGLLQNLHVNRLVTYCHPRMGTRCELLVDCMWLPVCILR